MWRRSGRSRQVGAGRSCFPTVCGVNTGVTLLRQRHGAGKRSPPSVLTDTAWLQWKETQLDVTVLYPGQVRTRNQSTVRAFTWGSTWWNPFTVPAASFHSPHPFNNTCVAPQLMWTRPCFILHDSSRRLWTGDWLLHVYDIQQVIAGAGGSLSSLLSGPSASSGPHRPHRLCLPCNDFLFLWNAKKIIPEQNVNQPLPSH